MLKLFLINEKTDILVHCECDLGFKEEIFLAVDFADLITIFYLAEVALFAKGLQFPF